MCRKSITLGQIPYLCRKMQIAHAKPHHRFLQESAQRFNTPVNMRATQKIDFSIQSNNPTIIFMDLSNHFIDSFDQLNINDQNIVCENITRHLVNWKNSKLFERIEKYIVSSIIEFKQEVSEQNIDITENLLSEQIADINQMLNNELETFDYYFNVEKCEYLCKIIFEIRFPKLECSYTYHGCEEGDGSSSYKTVFYDNHGLTKIECDILKLLFCEDNIQEVCYNWMHDYQTIKY